MRDPPTPLSCGKYELPKLCACIIVIGVFVCVCVCTGRKAREKTLRKELNNLKRQMRAEHKAKNPPNSGKKTTRTTHTHTICWCNNVNNLISYFGH